MKNLVLIMGVAIIVFFIYRLFLVLIGAFIMKVLKVNSKNYDKVDIWVSTSLYLIFAAGLITTIDVINKSADGTTNLDFYLSFCVFGISSIIWCYIKWSVNSIKSIPVWVDKEYLKLKRSIVFFVFFVLTLIIGYYQTLDALKIKEIDPLYPITNFTVITVGIALDRIMAQLHNPKNKYKVVLSMILNKDQIIEISFKKEYNTDLTKKSLFNILTSQYEEAINVFYDNEKGDIIYEFDKTIDEIDYKTYYLWDFEKQKQVYVKKEKFMEKLGQLEPKKIEFKMFSIDVQQVI
jgi:hypothetical protein